MKASLPCERSEGVGSKHGGEAAKEKWAYPLNGAGKLWMVGVGVREGRKVTVNHD